MEASRAAESWENDKKSNVSIGKAKAEDLKTDEKTNMHTSSRYKSDSPKHQDFSFVNSCEHCTLNAIRYHNS